MDLNEKMRELIDKLEDGTEEKLLQNKELIDEIAEYCKQSAMYNRAKEQADDFSKDKTALDCYQHLLIKVANAPTQLHVIGSTVLIMPLVADKLAGRQ